MINYIGLETATVMSNDHPVKFLQIQGISKSGNIKIISKILVLSLKPYTGVQNKNITWNWNLVQKLWMTGFGYTGYYLKTPIYFTLVLDYQCTYITQRYLRQRNKVFCTVQCPFPWIGTYRNSRYLYNIRYLPLTFEYGKIPLIWFKKWMFLIATRK